MVEDKPYISSNKPIGLGDATLDEVIKFVVFYGNFTPKKLSELARVNRTFRKATSDPLAWRIIANKYGYSTQGLDAAGNEVKDCLINTVYINPRLNTFRTELSQYLFTHGHKNRCENFLQKKCITATVWAPLSLSALFETTGSSVAACHAPVETSCCPCATAYTANPPQLLTTLYPSCFLPWNYPCSAATQAGHAGIWVIPIGISALVVLLGCGVEKLIERHKNRALESHETVIDLRQKITELQNRIETHGIFAQPRRIKMIETNEPHTTAPPALSMNDDPTETTSLLGKNPFTNLK
ncbi:MAG TPA: hypothetical protein VGV92_08610 [Gammaproteobacteria bacterium]|nr:hypothetical protein [Gammaproteobacteria bacterium]